MVRTTRRRLGDRAEQLAYRYLRRRGLRLIHRNFSCRLGELDLIMRDRDCVVVVEVRYRSGASIVPAEHTVDARKQAKITRATAFFLATQPQLAELPIRFDVVGVAADANGDLQLNWLRDAFRPGGDPH